MAIARTQPLAAKAIREKGTAEEAHLADIIDLKFLVMRQRIPDAVSHARAVIERDPEVAYYYYVISLTADHTLGLRFAKKGLRCQKALTPFVKGALLHRAVEHASDLALVALQTARVNDPKWEEGIAFLMSAWEDAKTFMNEAPPDSRHMKHVVNWYVVLTLALKGPEVRRDLGDLQARILVLSFDSKLNDGLGRFKEAPNQRDCLRVPRCQAGQHPAALDTLSCRQGLCRGPGRMGQCGKGL
jgi:hypothetical protein